MIPVIVGVADVKNRSTAVEDAKEPAQLMLEAIRRAIQDASRSQSTSDKLQASVDSIDVVRTWTWPYADLPALLAEKLGVSTKHRHYSEHGGNQPAKLLDEAALRVAKGDSKAAVITGAEALASLTSCFKNGAIPPPGWTEPSEPIEDVFSPTHRDLSKDIGGRHSVGAPIQVYPLYENGFRARRGQSIAQNHEESSVLYGNFSQVAQNNPYAWNSGSKETASSIGTVSKKNRMICFPYPLLMNAFNTVNLGAACIITSTEFAKQLQIPEDKWIYPPGLGETELLPQLGDLRVYRPMSQLEQSFSRRDRHLRLLFLLPDCPKARLLPLGPINNKPTEAYNSPWGPYFLRGAGNNYSMHAITEVTRQLRKGKGRNALILANGGVLSYQHAISLSRAAPKKGGPYPDSSTLRSRAAEIYPTIAEEANGPAVLETYTVEFKRDGKPKMAYIVGRLRSNGHRFLANHGDENTLTRLVSGNEDPIGKSGVVSTTQDGPRNLFYLDNSSKL
ncbi:hypothetical protein N7468_008455 [Penicillium chermesinum]|uniref:Thiolase-like protein type 1 additional C-terminal domain-containing protein n=1 Tax=Penicillium chermesinum TaxID=63820 RepID=A0A9W9NS23_9EURO|nr:uncharacterized protein N7468_008455 [Penicillium chermesinum]KAJ5223913.1 hypothetical protein N7468_008455 [Penicillium chermesinum]